MLILCLTPRILLLADSLNEALKIVGGVDPEPAKNQEDQNSIPVFNDSTQGEL